MRWLVLTVCISIVTAVSGVTLDVRIFSNKELTSSWVSVQHCTYYLVALNQNATIIDTVADIVPDKSRGTLHISVVQSRVKATYGVDDYGDFSALALIKSQNDGTFLIKGSGPERIYSGDLLFKSVSNRLLVVNRVPLEEYVAGVVESEGGHVSAYEYFKAQAVLARTWVLRNMDKHKQEGYNVKDDVTSQAYYSKAYLQNSVLIQKAVNQTKDTILLDNNGEVVFGAFHANSGGETVNSEDVWSGKIDYLRATPDTFSLKMDKAQWQKEINKSVFVAYFAKEMNISANDTAFVKAVCSFKQPTRMAYFTYGGKQLKLRWVREHFRLRSTYFSVYDQGNVLLLKGYGFGHGVGLSQEGAMRMAELGYTYKEILNHYFSQIQFGVVNDVLPQNKKS